MTGASHKSCALTAKPVHKRMLPTYKGLRISAKGPLDTSGPRRSLRVREIAPMWCTAQSRMASPIATISAPTIHNDAPGASSGGGKARRAATSGSGSHVRCRKSQPPRRDAKVNGFSL